MDDHSNDDEIERRREVLRQARATVERLSDLEFKTNGHNVNPENEDAWTVWARNMPVPEPEPEPPRRRLDTDLNASIRAAADSVRAEIPEAIDEMKQFVFAVLAEAFATKIVSVSKIR